MIRTLRGGQRALSSHVTTMMTKPELVINKLLPLKPEDLAAEFRAILGAFRPQVVLALIEWRLRHNPLVLWRGDQ
jgi:hypothetical protein